MRSINIFGLAVIAGTALTTASIDYGGAQSSALSQSLEENDMASRGLDAFKKRDYAEAMRWYRKAADQGNAKAKHDVGVLYLKGYGVPQDYVEAMRWFRKAADQGEASAQYAIGVMYGTGEGAPLDYAEAIRWYRKAADQGNTDAQYNIGALYYNGLGVPKDEAQALYWIRRGAEHGNRLAKETLAKLMAEKHGPAPFGDGLSRSLDPPPPSRPPGLPDLSKPVFVKASAVICKTEEGLFASSKWPLSSVGCTRVEIDTLVNVLLPQSFGESELRQGMFGYIPISWLNSDGTAGFGYVQKPSLRN